MKRFLSILLAILMLAVMLPVTAMAEDIPTLGNDNVWKNVTPANAQDVLDGKYGSIDGTTIVLTAGTYGQLELGRATKYPGSNTQYRIGSFDAEPMTFDAFYATKNDSAWSATPCYIRSMSNVTFKAAEGAEVKVAGVSAFSGHRYQDGYDYVLDRDVVTGTNTYYVANRLTNITFDHITFTAKSNIETSQEQAIINDFTFKNCTFNIGNTADNSDYIALRYYNENNNGNVRNLVVDNCEFNNCRQGVYTSHIKNVTVKGCTFDTTGHNAIAIQDFKGTCDHGNVVITGNTFKNVGDRIIRFNSPAAGTVITITKNTAVNSGKDVGGKKEIIAAEIAPLDGVTVKMAGNKWGENTKFGKGFENVVDEPIPEPSAPIVIVPDRTEDTPKTEPEKNPTTGANDMVAAAAALMAVSVLGMAVLSRKK